MNNLTRFTRKRKQSLSESKNKNFKDIFSIVFSLTAVLISFFTFYFSYFNVTNNIKARVTDIGLGGGYNQDSSKYWQTVIVFVAFINDGNRPGVVMSPTFKLNNISDVDGSFGYVLNQQEFPFILQPHEIKLVRLEVDHKELTDNIKSAATVKNDYSNKIESMFYCFLQYESIDYEGRFHRIIGKTFATATVDTQSVKVLSPLPGDPQKVNDYPETSLFR